VSAVRSSYFPHGNNRSRLWWMRGLAQAIRESQMLSRAWAINLVMRWGKSLNECREARRLLSGKARLRVHRLFGCYLELLLAKSMLQCVGICF
jgi:hypothetical protein